ncbi:MAG: hypothetical protein MZW92_01085 [Comamonadaceae bacterium]|nr:hypothetical protein [Comamonadaceae bacterium]
MSRDTLSDLLRSVRLRGRGVLLRELSRPLVRGGAGSGGDRRGGDAGLRACRWSTT